MNEPRPPRHRWGRLTFLMAAALVVLQPLAAGETASQNFNFKELAVMEQGESGEAYVFFVPRRLVGETKKVYVYDTHRRRLLIAPPGSRSLKAVREGRIEESEWIVLPDRIRPFLAPAAGADKADMRLSFPDTVRETKGAASKNRGRPEWIEIELEGRRLFLPSALLVKKLKREREGNLPIGREIVDRDTPLPLDYQPDDLIRIDRRWNFHGPDAPKHLRTEAARMLEVMLENARSRGIELRVLSAFRSSHRQRFLYLRETRRLGWDQRWTAKPGHSEHQLGTAVDLCTPDPVSVLNPDFDRTREGLWLEHHAGRFGFRRSYRQENQARTGYHPEPWHYRYFGFR